MVKGLGYFKKYFFHYSDRYVLIGGTACNLIMEDVGLDFRATKGDRCITQACIRFGTFLPHLRDLSLSLYQCTIFARDLSTAGH
ncbi:MAG: hypothetical protein S4CHLAM123_12390 [Chlamydiales bacterium]|nr:hypothetical protein [Chlamydiales bacterium]